MIVDNIELINRALHSSTIVNLYLSGCDLAEITVPESLPTSLKELDLSRAKNIPTELINRALGSSTIEILDLTFCDLYIVLKHLYNA